MHTIKDEMTKLIRDITRDGHCSRWFDILLCGRNGSKEIKHLATSSKVKGGDTMFRLSKRIAALSGGWRRSRVAKELLQCAADNGHADSCVTLVNILKMEKRETDWRQIVKLLNVAVKSDHTGARLQLGDCFFHGTGVDKNFDIAFNLYSQAADEGNKIAQFNVGVMMAEGRGCDKDIKTAMKWLLKSANQGHLVSALKLGSHMIKEQENIKDGLSWVEMSASRPHAFQKDASLFLGVFFFSNRSPEFKRNVPLSTHWFNRAKQQGHPKAEEYLARLSRLG